MSRTIYTLRCAAALALAGCSAAAGSTVGAAPSAQPLENAAATAVGTAAPAFEARTPDGAAVTLDGFRGKTLVLNFWATWCPPCRAETPDLIRAFGKLASDKVAFLAIDTTETAPIVKTFVALKGVPYPVALAGPQTYNAYGIAYIPTTVVIDPNGVVRARWTGGITPDQLTAYVASARAGKNAEFLTPEQRKIDALLTLPTFSVALAQSRLAAVNAYVDRLNQQASLRYDTTRTQAETGALELQAARALLAAAKTKQARVDAYEQEAQGYGDLNRYADAVGAHERARALDPKNPKILTGLTHAYYRLHDYESMEREAAAWTRLAPKDADAWDQLGLAYQRQQLFAQAVPAYQHALDLLVADAKNAPVGKDGDAVASVADESLDFANLYVALGDSAKAQLAFNQARAYAALIPSRGANAALKERVDERTLEGLEAASLAHGSGTHLALTPWTGPNLPGSVTSTYRYRLVAVAPAGTAVNLETKGLQPNWIASFCQDRLCSPNKVSFTMPPEGVKTYEFQLVPPSAGASPGSVSVGAPGANWVSTGGR